ncbi:MAG: M20/M25/M40 family metallo-hydrolase, partial [Pseudomonadota bacterium]|nr:M20/M25/M40 family metallo-hydrolase [Pseudomonadota bacterium]
TGRYPVISTSGGTSDGRFFASEHTQVVEVGVPNTTIHQINEHIHVSDLLTLEDIYTDILKCVGGRR